MPSLSEISDILGQYMLKGWVLTDKPCPTSGCAVPLMRSPASQTPQVTFCANCDGGPVTNLSKSSVMTSVLSDSSTSHPSRTSTPPTEISEVPSSPEFILPPETAETRRRRDQSDRASAEIGKRLLQGWAMLGEECPNESCFGVPLVRPPNVGGEKNPKKCCVICGNSYTSEVDQFGQHILRLVDSPVKSQPPPAASQAPAHVTKETPPSLPLDVPLSGPMPHSAPTPASQPHASYQNTSPFVSQHQHVSTSSGTVMLTTAESTFASLEDSRQALQRTLDSLNRRLDSLTSPSAKDPLAIAATAEAVTKVTQAIAQIRLLQWGENQIIVAS